jgi:hypothetical protein
VGWYPEMLAVPNRRMEKRIRFTSNSTRRRTPWEAR